MRLQLLSLLCVVLSLKLGEVDSWSGNYGPYTRKSFEKQSMCKCSTPEVCIQEVDVWRVKETIESRCRPGWTHNGDQNCDEPICNPPCSAGRCTRPNICSSQVSCYKSGSCFPGRCASSRCLCPNGFDGDNCLRLQDSKFKPLIHIGNITFAKNNLALGGKLEFQCTTDATNNHKIDVWTNKPQFNEMKFGVHASLDTDVFGQFLQTNLAYKFGIVETKVIVKHYKLNKGCEAQVSPADVVFVLDESGSVGSSYFKLALEAIVTVVKLLGIGSNRIRVALCLFEGPARTHFNLDFSFDKTSIIRKIKQTTYGNGGSTDIARALNHACNDMLTVRNGDRQNAKDYVVLMTDGGSSASAMRAAATRCKNKGVTIIAMGIGSGINSGDLQSIATSSKHYIDTTFQELHLALPDIVTQNMNCSSEISEILVNNKTHFCNKPSRDSPIANDVMKCELDEQTNYQVDSGDRVLVTYTVTTGGYRHDRGSYGSKEYYNGINSEINMKFKYDRDTPIHCSEGSGSNPCNSSRTLVPFQLKEDITRNPLKPSWEGWLDKLSGISRYSFEVWKMEYSSDNQALKEPDITAEANPRPLFIRSLGPNDPFPSFQPSSPGMYSTILEVVDKANNSRFARRLAIFDDSSTITTRTNHPIRATSASSETNFVWQTNGGEIVSFSWVGHFINEVHENRHILSKVKEYSPRLSDGIGRHNYKKIDGKFDDNDGDRSLEAIPNVNSIVKFEYSFGPVSQYEPSRWTPHELSEQISLSQQSIEDGDSRQFWIRAHDIMGNTKINSTILNFDKTAPQFSNGDIKLEKNIKDGRMPFSSRVTISAKDEHSAVHKIEYIIKEKETGKVMRKEVNVIEKIWPCSSAHCNCVSISGIQQCYYIEQSFEIDNCWLKVPIDKVDTEIIVLDINVYNSANLFTEHSIELGKVKEFNGIGEYKSPSNITIKKRLDTSVSISWEQAPTCYKRAGIVIKLYKPDNTTTEYKVDKEATSFDLTGLNPTSDYSFELFTKYGNKTEIKTSPLPGKLAFKTDEEKTIPWPIVGAALGVLVALLVLFIVLGRTGKLAPAKARMIEASRNISVHRHGNDYARMGYKNRAKTTDEEDDIYFYGTKETIFDSSRLSRNDIALESMIAEGKFATIYLAKYVGKRDDRRVVAKILKDEQSEENVMKMKAKINFYAEKVGHHKNVVDFIGSVQDDVARGPFMVLEYCENGVLRDYLQQNKSKVTMELEERLCRFCFGIAHGMDYLASKQIVHRRLAARNILLDHLFETKITGFGPDPQDAAGAGEGSKQGERLPLKWMAPECQKSTNNANELSDVFSFGIVMWEIFSLGETPYPGIQSKEVLSKQKQGYKMKKPECCSDDFYKLMLKCWHFYPSKRPGFEELKQEMTNMFQQGSGDDYYYRSNDI